MRNPIEAIKGAIATRRMHIFVKQVKEAEERSYRALSPDAQMRFNSGSMAFNLRVFAKQDRGEGSIDKAEEAEKQALYWEGIHNSETPLATFRENPPTFTHYQRPSKDPEDVLKSR